MLFKLVFTLFRSSHRRWFIKKAVLKNFTIFTWKRLCWSLFLMKLQAFRSAILLERDSNTGVLLSLLRKFKNTYFEEHLQTSASVYWNDLLIYLNCVIKNMLPERFWVCKEKCHLRRHGVKVGPEPRDTGPPQSLKVGPGTPLKFKSGTPDTLQNLKVGSQDPFKV